MVGGEDQHLRRAEFRRQRLLHAADLQGDLLQQSERAERLGLVVDLVLQGGVERVVDAGNGEVHGGQWMG